MATFPSKIPDEMYRYPYESPTPGRITVIATGLQRDKGQVLSEEVFRNIVACNFNLVSLIGSNEDGFKKTLANTKGNIGVQATNYYLLPPHSDDNQDMELQKAKDFYDAFKNFIPEDENGNPLDFEPIKAWSLKDEPVYKQLADKTNGYNLHTIYNYIRSGELARKNADQSKSLRPIQVNLVGAGEPKYMEGILLEIATPDKELEKELKYQIYLDAFESYNPSLWSYDLYPISRNLKAEGALRVKYNRFYKDLITFSRRAKANSKVFWAYAQSMEFITSSKNTLYPAATIPYLRFEIFSALAFGAQGIVYWTYQMRENTDETYLSALIDMDFNKMPAWYAAQKVNAEIYAYSEVFVGSKLLGYTHIGNADTGYPVLDGDFGPIKYISATKISGIGGSTSEEGLGALITRIRTNGSEFIVIVSHDVENSQQIRISFSPNAVISGTKIDNTGKMVYVKMNSNISHLMTLEPGGYLIFKHVNA